LLTIVNGLLGVEPVGASTSVSIAIVQDRGSSRSRRGISGHLRSLLASEALEDDFCVAIDSQILDGRGVWGGRRAVGTTPGELSQEGSARSCVSANGLHCGRSSGKRRGSSGRKCVDGRTRDAWMKLHNRGRSKGKKIKGAIKAHHLAKPTAGVDVPMQITRLAIGHVGAVVSPSSGLPGPAPKKHMLKKPHYIFLTFVTLLNWNLALVLQRRPKSLYMGTNGAMLPCSKPTGFQ
jgi:hypothetical protein